jgi:hypothetical protein
VMIAAGVVFFRVALSYRVQIGPERYTLTNWRGGVAIMMTAILLGLGVPLVMRSPFQRPLGERLFRLVWLGPIGHRFVRFSGRKVWRKSASGSRTGASSGVSRVAQPNVQPPPVAIPPSAIPQLASLESRVAELEKWRLSSRAGSDARRSGTA